MRSRQNPTLEDLAPNDGSAQLPAKAAAPKNGEQTSDGADTNFLAGYISEQGYAQQRAVTLRTCQRDRQLRKSPPYIKLGRNVFYRLDGVRDWLMKNERIADQTPSARPRLVPKS